MPFRVRRQRRGRRERGGAYRAPHLARAGGAAAPARERRGLYKLIKKDTPRRAAGFRAPPLPHLLC